MNALLKPIEARAIERPTFNNDNLGSVSKWTHDNYQALRDCYKALGKALPSLADDNADGWRHAQGFCSWIACQWDREIYRSAH